MNYNRRDFLKASAGAAVLPGLRTKAISLSLAGEQPRPNLLFVFTDQQSFDMLGCYGNDEIITPELDQLAAEGLRFEYCISSNPVCTPYRGMLLSGQHQLKNGAFSNDVCMLPGNGTYFGEVLRDHGYRTGYIGKWHLYGGDRNRPVPAGPYRYGFDDVFLSNNCALNFDPDAAFYFDQHTGEKIHFNEWEVYGQTEQAKEFIRESSQDTPWALFVSWHPPHDHKGNKYTTLPELEALYNPDEITLRPSQTDSPEVRKDMQGYMAMCTGCDIAFGQLMQTLKEQGMNDNTIVVFTSDHGDLHGAHGRPWAKSFPEDESCRVPLLIHWPKHLRPRSSDLLVGTLDFMPTLLGMMGLPIPDTCDGQNLTPHIFAENDDAVDSVPLFYSGPSWRGVFTKQFTYSERAPAYGTQEQSWDCLYDRTTDPYQLTNRFDDPQYATHKVQLRGTMQQWLDRFNDPFLNENRFLHVLGFSSFRFNDPEYGPGMHQGRPVDLLANRDLLTNRYRFEESTNDSAGHLNGSPTGEGTWIEPPRFSSERPAGAVSTAPTHSLQLGMNAGSKKSGFSLNPAVIDLRKGSLSFWMHADALSGTTYILSALPLGSGPLIRGGSAESITIGAGGQSLAAPLSTGSWHHLVVTWDNDNGTAALFLDGSAAGTLSFPASGISPTTVRAGGFNLVDSETQLDNQFKGFLYDLQFYEGRLSPSQVAHLASHPGSR